MRWRRRRRCFSGSIRNWDNSFNHPLIENIVVKKAKGKENEYCTLLSDTSYSKALPMLLCTEDDVEGEHSTATGKVDEKALFYIMTRGISEKEAKKMIVKAKFNSVIQGIKEETVQNLILEEVDRRLD